MMPSAEEIAAQVSELARRAEKGAAATKGAATMQQGRRRGKRGGKEAAEGVAAGGAEEWDAFVALRLQFIRKARRSFGNTALLMSGGATLGLYHLGVIKVSTSCHRWTIKRSVESR